MNGDESFDLEQALRDERAQRYAVEERLIGETEKAALWRKRAEDRAERIAALDQRRAKRWWRRRAPTRPAAPGPAAPTVQASLAALPVVRVGAAVTTAGLGACLDTMTRLDIGDGRNALYDSDLVVVEPSALAAWPAEARAALDDWRVRPARQPLVLWIDAPDSDVPAGLVAAADVVAVTDTGLGSPTAGGRDRVLLPPSFDPRRCHPGVGSTAVRDVTAGLPAEPSYEFIADAAAGAALLATTPSDEWASARAGVAARRWAYRHHAPWVRAARLLDLAGVSYPDPLPQVAGILVSMRPELATRAVELFARQSYERKELVVGVHGAPLEPVAGAVESLDLDFPCTVVRYDAERPLGWCLNEAISHTGAAVLAKIDDDDHYGPGYLEDAVQALMYSGAGIVGKAAQFTYVEELGRTLLRRRADEERFIGGTPTGGGMVWRRSVWDRVRFPHRPRFVDKLFVAGARTVGEQVYANSRWEFRLFRSGSGHTYAASADLFLAGASDAWDGDQPHRVEVADLR